MLTRTIRKLQIPFDNQHTYGYITIMIYQEAATNFSQISGKIVANRTSKGACHDEKMVQNESHGVEVLRTRRAKARQTERSLLRDPFPGWRDTSYLRRRLDV